MSDTVNLTLRAPLTERIEAECIVPDRFVELDEPAIAALPLWRGRERVALGDVFEVRGGRASRLRVVGNVALVDGIGTAMSSGELLVDGDAGRGVGTAMTGGRLEVFGSAGDAAGTAMTGGALIIQGRAGDRLGGAAPGASRGMTGGEIVVGGSVGGDAGVRMRRGLLFVGGDAGEGAARAIIAGTVIILGRVGRDSALGSKRGTLAAAGGVDVPSTYQYACTYQPPHLRLALVHLQRRYGVDVPRDVIEGQYHRFCGDAGTVARGEILEWASA